jgi:hypothetical protein
MANTRNSLVSTMIAFLTLAGTNARRTLAAAATLIFAVTCMAQDQNQPQPPSPPDSQTGVQASATSRSDTVTIPSGTRIALVLTHPIQSRHIHRGDDIYAQTISPVNSGNEMVIPPGTFVQGTVDKLERRGGGRAELHLQSMSITFPDGYVAPISGSATLESSEGYALNDPGQGRVFGMVALPAAGAGLGALIGHATASSQSGTLTSSLPPGCTGPPPGCLTSSLSVRPDKGKNTVIGAAVGGAVGLAASLLMLAGSHHFFIDVGSPLEMVLQHPVSLKESESVDAVRRSEQHLMATQPMVGRPVPPPPPPDTDHGTCYTPGAPGTPPTVIPGMPGPDGVPGPPTTIPGTPPTPGTPYPCP